MTTGKTDTDATAAGGAATVADGGRRRRASGGPEARRAARRSGGNVPLPAIVRKIAEYEVLDEAGLQIIEHNADLILEQHGIDIRDDDETVALWKAAGADVKYWTDAKGIEVPRIHFPRGLCRKIIQASAPRTFRQFARNAERSVEIGGKNTVFAPVYGPPFVRDLKGERRYGTIQDFQDLVKLAYMAPAIHHSGGTVCEPVDVGVHKRHLDMVYAHIKYSDKPFMGSVTAPERAEDSVTMARMVFGEKFVDENCVLISLINVNSPMTYDGIMLGALRVYARANQATIVTPFILSGAMSAVSQAGTLTQVLAEVLVGAATTQLYRKGAPVVFGVFASSMSMQSGAPTFGTPEPSLVIYGAAQLARRLGIPFRSGGGLCASKMPDAQAAYESAQTMNPTLLAGTNFVLHAAGWLEGGLVSSFAKFVMDADQCAMYQRMANGIDMSENGQALDAIAEVRTKYMTHFLDTDHTRRNFEDAFYRSTVADNNSFEQWTAEGEKRTEDKATEVATKWLAEYEAPALDPGIDEALKEFIAKKKATLPDSLA
jgi:trimethylamine---corrinoid protein Co-methyltransferase